MQQTNAHDDSESVSLRISHVALVQSSDLCMRQADAPDVSQSVSLITRPVAPLQPELSGGKGQHLSR
eukprot:8109785-Pyramimonas_sp.AAC.1